MQITKTAIIRCAGTYRKMHTRRPVFNSIAGATAMPDGVFSSCFYFLATGISSTNFACHAHIAQRNFLPLPMHFQLSVFYQGSLFLYAINTEDKKTFSFLLKSAPEGKQAPEEFTVLHPEKDIWIVEPAMDEEFTAGIARTMKRTKL